jgi:hypothetical protein
LLLSFAEATDRTNREHMAVPSSGFKRNAFRLVLAGIAVGRDALPRPKAIDSGKERPY